MEAYVFEQAWEHERSRLNGIESQWDPGTIRFIEEMNISEGWRCLEVAAGAGSIAQWLAQRVGPTGRVVATDLDTRFLSRLETPNLTVLQHDILTQEIGEAQFDLVHCRALLEHVPSRLKGLRHMVKAVKPGGILFVEDVRFLADSPGRTLVLPSAAAAPFRRVFAAIHDMMVASGYDGMFTNDLPGHLEDCGLFDVRAEGRKLLTRGGTASARFMGLTVAHAGPRLADAGKVSREDVDYLLAMFQKPEFSFMSYMMVSAWGRKPVE